MTIGELLRKGHSILKDSSDAPHLDAQYLLLHAISRSESSWLHAHSDETLSAAQQEHFLALLAARAAGQPLAYVLGQAEFYGRLFMVTPAVLIPRPATEELIDQALTVIKEIAAAKKRPLQVADIGTGSGCIAVTLALETTLGRVEQIYATDISPAALAVAQKNAKRHAVTSRIMFKRGDMLAPLHGLPLDLIVSNPPYVPEKELQPATTAAKIATRGLAFEPHVALAGGSDGNFFVQQLRATGVPLLAEVTGGIVKTFNIAHS